MARSEEEKRKILEEARGRFKRAMEWEYTARQHYRDDVKFAEGDSYNNFQWPQQQLSQRVNRPSLTINRVRQHNLDILNDARQSKVAVKIRPLRGGASYDSAQILDGLIKHIEYISNADSAYQHALKCAVQGGWGYIRLVTDYAADDSFDQDIFIRRVADPLSVLLDPDITEFDGSDATFGFVFTDMPRDEFNKVYPKLKDIAPDNEIGADDSWVIGKDKVRIAEYFRCVRDEDALIAYTDPQTGQQVTAKKSELEKEMLDSVIDDPDTAIRTIVNTKVEHFKIIGDQLTDEKEWPGKYIPLLRCIGEETVIDGILDRKGHTRALLDAQRIFNYANSGAVEYGALQTKIPHIGPAAAFEGYEEYWKRANVENFSFLPYKHVDDEGNPIPAPARQAPPSPAPVYIQEARDAMEWMYLASGQNQADFGQPGNEKSGVAIQQRQRQGDNATYHYLDHQASMIRLLGKMIIDLFPAVYDTKRIMPFRDDAGKEGQVMIDPEAEQHFVQSESTGEPDEQFAAIMNPKLGVYDVQADVGPAFATRRQEAFNAFSQLLGQNKELFQIVGDVWMRFSDIPGAEEAAERLRRMVPSQALGGPSPEIQNLQMELQKAQHLVTQLSLKLEDKANKNTYENDKNAITAYKATTERLAAIKEALATDPEGLKVLVREVIEEGQHQSAGGNALMHILEPSLEADQIHPDLGGQLQPPPPHAPPVDPNNLLPSPEPQPEPTQ